MRARVLRLLITERVHHPELLEKLKTSFEVTEGDFDGEALRARVRDANALWVKLRYRIDKELLSGATDLQWIATPTTGLNHIDMEYAQRRGIEVISLRGEVEFLRTIRATAELTVGLILSLLRKIPAAVDHVRAGEWNRDLFQGTELYGKTLGIIGLGRLGNQVAALLQAFGMTVLACDPRPREVPANVSLVSLDELAKSSDVISVHASYESGAHELLNRDFFQAVKRGVVLVNTARGEIVDELALIDALESGRLAGAAVDVVSEEHRRGGALVRYAQTHANLLITPHIGGNTEESRRRTDLFLADKLIASCARAKSASHSHEG